MKNKTIFAVFCVLLVLLLVSSSYGWPPKRAVVMWEFREDPEPEIVPVCRSDDVVLLVAFSWSGFHLVICVVKDCSKAHEDSRPRVEREERSKTTYPERAR